MTGNAVLINPKLATVTELKIYEVSARSMDYLSLQIDYRHF